MLNGGKEESYYRQNLVKNRSKSKNATDLKSQTKISKIYGMKGQNLDSTPKKKENLDKLQEKIKKLKQ